MVECQHGYDCCPICDVRAFGFDGVVIELTDDLVTLPNEREMALLGEMRPGCASSEHNALNPNPQPCCIVNRALKKLASASVSNQLTAMSQQDDLYGDAVRDEKGRPIKKTAERVGMKDGRITYAVDDAAGIRASMKKLGLDGAKKPVKTIHEGWMKAKEFWDRFDIVAARSYLAGSESQPFSTTERLLETFNSAIDPELSREGPRWWGELRSELIKSGYRWVPSSWGGYIAMKRYVEQWEERNGERP